MSATIVLFILLELPVRMVEKCSIGSIGKGSFFHSVLKMGEIRSPDRRLEIYIHVPKNAITLV